MQSLNTITTSSKKEEIKIAYNLIFKNALYSLECFRVGGNLNDPSQYCFVENISEDEDEAETFMKRLERGKVLPVHIKDLVEDFLN